MAEKVTTMVLKVDLECSCSYKKIKKILCKFPQIRNQVYDDNEKTVTITAVCCNPEKFCDKLCCKGGKVIKSIKIKPKNPVPIPVGCPPFYPQGPCCGPCYEGYGRGPCYHGYGRPPPPSLRPCYDGRGCGEIRGCYVNTLYFNDENASACAIM